MATEHQAIWHHVHDDRVEQAANEFFWLVGVHERQASGHALQRSTHGVGLGHLQHTLGAARPFFRPQAAAESTGGDDFVEHCLNIQYSVCKQG